MKRLTIIAAVFVLNFLPPTYAQSYAYDAAGRLIGVTWPNGRAIRYAYDASDNLVSAIPTTVAAAPAISSALELAPGQNRVSWVPAGAAPTSWLVERRLPGGAWQTIATVAGTATSFTDTGAPLNAEYRVAATGSSGTSAWSRTFRPSSLSSVEVPIPRLGAVSLTTRGDRPTTAGGYVTAEVEYGSVPYGAAIFNFIQNGTLITEAAVASSPPVRRSLIAIEYRQGVTSAGGQYEGAVTSSTGVGIANPVNRAINIELTLRDREGRVATTARGGLGAGAHTALLLQDLHGLAPGFSVPSNFATVSGIGTLEVVCDVPISVMALRVTINQRGEALFTSTPVTDMDAAVPTGPALIPHFAEGGGFNTAILLANPGSEILTGVIEFFSSNGAAARVPTVAHGEASSFTYRILPRGAALIETTGVGDVRSGWIRTVPDGTLPAPRGAAVFRLGQNGVVVGEAGVPSSLATTHSRIWVDRRNGRDTGAAIANPSTNSTATVSIRAYSTDGSTPATDLRQITLPARGHNAALSEPLAGVLPRGFVGMLDITSSHPLAVLSLRFVTNSRGELVFSTLPVADLTRFAPWPVYFPHIAEGGGFRTELIFLGPQSPASVRANFFDDHGAPFPVASGSENE